MCRELWGGKRNQFRSSGDNWQKLLRERKKMKEKESIKTKFFGLSNLVLNKGAIA